VQLNTIIILVILSSNGSPICNNFCDINQLRIWPHLVFLEPDWNVCIYLTQLYDGRDTYIIYYIKNNYMFRNFTLAIFRFRNEKNLVSSYTPLMWVVYSGEVRGGVGTRSRMCYVEWVVWVHGF